MPVPVRLELLLGARKADLGRLRRLFAALPALTPAAGTWTRLDGWIDRTVAAGQHFGFGDLLIGALAADSDAEVWSLDQDFDRLAGLGLVTLHAGPA